MSEQEGPQRSREPEEKLEELLPLAGGCPATVRGPGEHAAFFSFCPPPSSSDPCPCFEG